MQFEMFLNPRGQLNTALSHLSCIPDRKENRGSPDEGVRRGVCRFHVFGTSIMTQSLYKDVWLCLPKEARGNEREGWCRQSCAVAGVAERHSETCGARRPVRLSQVQNPASTGKHLWDKGTRCGMEDG